MKVMYLCREILNEERCPGFLLEAVHSAIKKKRKLIKAKMLGTTVNECSSRSLLTHSFIAYGSKGGNVQKRTQVSFFASDDEERTSLFGRTEVDGRQADGTDKPAESRIQNL